MLTSWKAQWRLRSWRKGRASPDPRPPSWKPRARPRGAAAQGRLGGPGVARGANSLQTGRRDLRLAGSDVPHPTCSRPVRRFRASDLAERALSSSPKRSLESCLPSVGAGVAPTPKWSSLCPEAGREGTHTHGPELRPARACGSGWAGSRGARDPLGGSWPSAVATGSSSHPAEAVHISKTEEVTVRDFPDTS